MNSFLSKDETDNEGNIWYFAYGANMNDTVFKIRRMIKPFKSVPGKVRNW
jgi:hypothetical protein